MRLGGFDLPYLEGGRGDPVVMLHGFGDNKDSFVEVAGELVEHHRVVLPDLPGFGDSIAPPGTEFKFATFVEVMRRFLEEVVSGPLHLAGNSLGGAIATAIALDVPQRVRSLALIGAAGLTMPTPSPLQERIEAGENPFAVRDPDAYHAWIRFVLERPPAIPWGVSRHLAEQFVRRADEHERILGDLLREHTDLTDRLPHMDVPTLVLWGSHDRLIHRSVAHVFHREIARARLVVLHGIGHCPQYEDPSRTAWLLRRLFSGG